MPLIWQKQNASSPDSDASMQEYAVQASREFLLLLYPEAAGASMPLSYRVVQDGDTYTVHSAHMHLGITAPSGADNETVRRFVWRKCDDDSLMLLDFQRSTKVAIGEDMRALGQKGIRTTRIPLQANDSSGTTHWLSPEDIVYVEANHQYTNVHCRTKNVRLRATFSNVVEQLGDTVMKVHRSYAVNPLYASHLEREILYLTTGDKVPVPSKRVRQVRKDLMDWSRQLGSRI